MATPSFCSSLPAGISEDLFTCAVCFNPFDQDACKPKLLPCHHTFCSRCLFLLTSAQDQLRCPLCNKMCAVKASGIESLPTNHYLVTFLDVLQSLQHQNVPVISPADADTSSCKKHSNAPRFFWCDTCCQAICTHCTAIDHALSAGHLIRDIDKARKELQDKILSMLTEIKIKFTVIKVMRNQIQEMKSTNAEKAIRVLRNAVASSANSMAHVVSDETLNPNGVIDKVSNFVESEAFGDTALLKKNYDRLSGLVTTLNSVEQFLHQKRQEVDVLMKSKVFVTLIRPEVQFNYERVYCPRCGEMCGIPEKIASGKQPYKEQTTEHTCNKCGITVIEV